MTERQGLFTVQTILVLSPEHRAQLEHLVRERRSEPADVITQILAERPLDQLPSSVVAAEGEAIHARIYLTPEQREAFEEHLAAHDLELSPMVSQIVADYLTTLPAIPAPVVAAPPRVDIGKRRADLARLRARRDAAGNAAPAWLNDYIAEMESELHRLEHVA